MCVCRLSLTALWTAVHPTCALSASPLPSACLPRCLFFFLVTFSGGTSRTRREMPRARHVVRLLLVSSAPAVALLVLSFSGGQHLRPSPSVDSRLRWQSRWCQGSSKRCRGSLSPTEETATRRSYHCSRLTLHCRSRDQDLDFSASTSTPTVDDDDDQKKSSRTRRINGDKPAEEVAVVADASSMGTTRYTIDMDVHPDVADVAVKHARQLSRFLEHHPISAHTEQAYALATKFVRDFHLSRRGSGNAQPSLGQVQGRGEEEGLEEGGQEEEEEEAVQQLLRRPLPVVLDAGCGTGRSSILLAKSHPHLPVLGIDRSAVRLSKGHGRAGRDNEAKRVPLSRVFREGEDLERGGHEQVVDGVIDDVSGDVPSQGGPCGDGGSDGSGRNGRRRRREKGGGDPLPENLLLLRADLVDLWILASRNDAWRVEEHSILYPNPYPKRSQLRSRWHGHPVFPVLLGLGGRITLRSNWKPYLEEVCRAVLAISEGNQEGEAAAGGAGGGGAAGEPLLGGREGGVLPSTNDGGPGTRGVASGSATVAVVAAAPAVAKADCAGNAAPSRLAGRRRENAAGRYAGRSYARGQGVRPRDQWLSKTAGRPLTASRAEAAERLVGSSNSNSSNNNAALVGGGGVGAADVTSEVPPAIAAAAASYEASARAGPSLYVPVVPATNFEAKYKTVGETVYELCLEPRLTR